MKEKRAPIENVLLDAKIRYKRDFGLVKTKDSWAPYASFCIMGDFEHLRHGYRQHCGPTALTNLLLTLKNIHSTPELAIETPQSLFVQTARLGRRMLAYYNISLFGRFGGTSWFLMGLYLRMALRKYKVNDHVIVHPYSLAKGSDVVRQLDKGRLVFLQMLHHPTYKAHDVVAYGYQELKSPQGGKVFYLKIADGWSRRPRFVAAADLPLCSMWALEVN